MDQKYQTVAEREQTPYERSIGQVSIYLTQLEDTRKVIAAEAQQHEAAASQLRQAQSLIEHAIEGLRGALQADGEMSSPTIGAAYPTRRRGEE